MMKNTCLTARRVGLLAIAAAAGLAFATTAQSADGSVPLGTWAGEIRLHAPDRKVDTIVPVKFDFRSIDVEQESNALRYFGPWACKKSAQYVGRGGAGYQFVLKGAGGGHCDKAGSVVLLPEGGGLRLQVLSSQESVLDEAVLQLESGVGGAEPH